MTERPRPKSTGSVSRSKAKAASDVTSPRPLPAPFVKGPSPGNRLSIRTFFEVARRIGAQINEGKPHDHTHSVEFEQQGRDYLARFRMDHEGELTADLRDRLVAAAHRAGMFGDKHFSLGRRRADLTFVFNVTDVDAVRNAFAQVHKERVQRSGLDLTAEYLR